MHKIKIGDEVQVVFANSKKWWMGTFAAVYTDGDIKLTDAIPLYPIGASYDPADMQTLTGRPVQLWVYTEASEKPVLQHTGPVHEVLDPSATPFPKP